ncbi:hypothetical protein BMS3Abin16_01700 [archaeon BMS3Abin16]|nr:hypothetical protein BMS3Abin16_01700 [archaeon BMS3Abin16]HDY74744.1 hypothetical protein [Euryarchaeota archaeon]
MGVIKTLLVVAIVLISIASVSALKINYNTTHPLQFMGLDSFENQGEVRVIFRAEPISIRAGEVVNLNFRVENPTVDVHRVMVSLIDVPPGFSVVDSGSSIRKEVSENSSEQIVFTLMASEDIAPRSYFYGFDVVDEALGSDGKTVESTLKQLGTYSAINILGTGKTVETPVVEEETEVVKNSGKTRYTGFLALVIIISLLLLFLQRRAKK